MEEILLDKCVAVSVPLTAPKELPKQVPDDRLKQLIKQTKDDLLGSTYQDPYSGAVLKQLRDEKHSREKTPGARLIPKVKRKISKEFLETVSRDIETLLRDHECDWKACGPGARRVVELAIMKEFQRHEYGEAHEYNIKLNKELDERSKYAVRTILDTLEDIQLGLMDNPVQAIRKLKETRW